MIYKIYLKELMLSAMTADTLARYGKGSAAVKSRINARNTEAFINNLLNFKWSNQQSKTNNMENVEVFDDIREDAWSFMYGTDQD